MRHPPKLPDSNPKPAMWLPVILSNVSFEFSYGFLNVNRWARCMCPKSSCRLKNGFYPLRCMAAILSRRRDFPLLSHQPTKRLCATCVIFLFGTEFGLCVLLRCAGCFWGCFIALESSLHWPNVKRTKAVEAILHRWASKALDDGMPGDLFLATLANSI